MTALILMVVQALILIQMGLRPGNRPDQNLWSRYLAPLTIFSFFYAVYVWMPQVYGYFNDYFMLGFESRSLAVRESAFVRGQGVLVLFLLCVWGGAILTGPTAEEENEQRDLPEADPPLTNNEIGLLAVLFVVGVGAYLELSSSFREIDGFRSELLQNTRGRVLTAVAFSANFAFAAFLSRLLHRKLYFVAAALSGVFAFAVLGTGSRGRILWPILIGLALFSRFEKKIPRGYAATVGIGFPFSLVILDQLSARLRGTSDGGAVAVDWSQLFLKRNFDSFANFSLILDSSTTQPSLGTLSTGARLSFMQEFFPALWARGVGTGVTIPGWFHYSAGVIGVFVLGGLYGASLGLIGRVHLRMTGLWASGTYLAGMSWYVAIGGNLVESLDKMVVQMAPGFLLIAASSQLTFDWSTKKLSLRAQT